MESEDDLCGPSDAELDSEVEDMDDDAETELSIWLDQLNMIQQENGSTAEIQKRHSQKISLTPKMAMDSFRMSILESGGTQDVDLDAILGELCELETQLSTQQTEINTSLNQQQQSNPLQHRPPVPPHSQPPPVPPHKPGGDTGGGGHPNQPPTHPHSQRDSGFENIDSQFQNALHELSGLGESLDYGAQPHDQRRPKMSHPSNAGPSNGLHGGEMGNEPGNHDYDYPPSEREGEGSDPSQDTDSAYSDTISLPSSGSHISVTTTSSGGSGSSSGSSGVSSGVSSGISPTAQGEHAARMKAEKVKLALDKIKEANIKKLFVRCYSLDGSSKSILVDENMTVAQVCDILVVKNHDTPSVHWGVVEQLPDLYMERMLEDHDNLVDNILMWSRDSTNKLVFLERPDKYDVFRRPEEFLLGPGGASELRGKIDDAGRGSLIQEYFSPTSKRVPEMEGTLYLKAEGKKAWKKFFFVLRASGLYYNPRGKSKTSKDLVCLQQCDFAEVYTGLSWKKKYKAPTEHCFALKHPQIQKKAVKYIRYLCADNAHLLHQWVTAIRIAKHGHQMLINFESVKNSVATWDARNMPPHQDLVSLLSQPAPAHMAALAATGSKTPSAGKDQVQPVPSAPRQCPHHQRVPSGGGHQRLSSSSVGSPRHSASGSSISSEEPTPTYHRPTKMTPVIPVTTEVTRQITDLNRKQSLTTLQPPEIPDVSHRRESEGGGAGEKPPPKITHVPPQQHPPWVNHLEVGAGNVHGSMDLPPPPPDMVSGALSAHESGLQTGSSEFPPPPPAVAEQYVRPMSTHTGSMSQHSSISQLSQSGSTHLSSSQLSQLGSTHTSSSHLSSASSQPGSNRSSASSTSLGLPASPIPQSPRHSISHTHMSPRHSLTGASGKPPVPLPSSPSGKPPVPVPNSPPTPSNMGSPIITPGKPPVPLPNTPPTPNSQSIGSPLLGSPMSQAPMSPGSSLLHRRSSSGPSTPTHSGGRKPPPPPIPRRSDTTQLSMYNDSKTGQFFMADLQRVLTLKQSRSKKFMTEKTESPDFPPAPPPIAPLPQPHYTSVDEDFADLPPPPEELLEGLPGHEKRKPPPPPPKRHLQTQLSFSRGQIQQ